MRYDYATMRFATTLSLSRIATQFMCGIRCSMHRRKMAPYLTLANLFALLRSSCCVVAVLLLFELLYYLFLAYIWDENKNALR